MRDIGVLGLGTIGSGLALYLPQCGYRVTAWTRRSPQTARASLREGLRKLVQRGILTAHQTTDVLSKLRVTRDLTVACGTDLVIEATREDAPTKRGTLAKAAAAAAPEALIATTTSSLRVADLAPSVLLPGRFLAMHFLAPVARMELVELAPGPLTSPDHLRLAENFVRSLGKQPLVVPDTPGFLVNRIVLAECNRAIQLLEERIASVSEIDLAMRLGAARPSGPLELGDAIGWDIVLAALDNLYRETRDEGYCPRPLLRALVARGRLGRKAGRGLYRYDAPWGRKQQAYPVESLGDGRAR